METNSEYNELVESAGKLTISPNKRKMESDSEESDSEIAKKRKVDPKMWSVTEITTFIEDLNDCGCISVCTEDLEQMIQAFRDESGILKNSRLERLQARLKYLEEELEQTISERDYLDAQIDNLSERIKTEYFH